MRLLARVVGGLLLCAPARAEPSTTDKAVAESLFDLGRTLMRAGKYEEACPKFADSQRLDPGVGTLLFLGECFARTGRVTNAWTTFREAMGLAHTEGDARREAVASQRAQQLEPLLGHLVIHVAPEAVSLPGLTIWDGETALSRSAWEVPLPVDPGDHVVRASAAAHQDFSAVVHVAPGSEESVTVDLAPEPTTPAPLPPPVEPTPLPPRPPHPTVAHRVSTWTVVMFGVAGLGIGVGSVFGAFSMSLTSDLKTACTSGCPSSRASDLSTAWNEAWAANIGFGVGVVAAIVATVSLVRNVTIPVVFQASAQGGALGLRF